MVDIFGISKFYQYKSQRICKRIIFKFQIIFVIFQKKLRPFFWVGKSKVFFSFFWTEKNSNLNYIRFDDEIFAVQKGMILFGKPIFSGAWVRIPLQSPFWDLISNNY